MGVAGIGASQGWEYFWRESFLSWSSTEGASNGQLPLRRLDSYKGGPESQGRQPASPLRSLPESAGDAPSAREGDDSRYKHERQAHAYPASTLAMDWPVA